MTQTGTGRQGIDMDTVRGIGIQVIDMDTGTGTGRQGIDMDTNRNRQTGYRHGHKQEQADRV